MDRPRGTRGARGRNDGRVNVKPLSRRLFYDSLVFPVFPVVVSLLESDNVYFSLSKSAKVLPASASRFNNGAGSHNSPCSSWNWLTRSYTFFRPTVFAYHIGPPRQAG